MDYEMFEFTYKARSLQMVVLARKKETADEIASIQSTDSHFVWKRKLFGFKKRTIVSVPPLEIEEEQLEVARLCLEHRRGNLSGEELRNKLGGPRF